MGDSHVGLQARLMSQALRKLTGCIEKQSALLYLLTSLEKKFGVVYGNPETTTGGRALKFYASIRIEIRKADAIKQGTEIIGNRTKAKIVKNKVAPPFKVSEFDILYGKGVSKEGDILDLAADLDIINKSGAWYSYKETRIGQGRENAKAYLVSNPDICAEVENEVRKSYGLPGCCASASMTVESTVVKEEEEEKDPILEDQLAILPITKISLHFNYKNAVFLQFMHEKPPFVC